LSPLSNLTEIQGIYANNGGYGAPDFRGLESLETIRNLSVFDEPALESLEGFESLQEVGIISLENVPNLRSLAGLNGLQRINQRAYYDDSVGIESLIRRADALEDLSGLDSLVEIDGRIQLEDNRGLESFEGAESLRSAGEFLAIGNPELSSLDGFEGVQTANQLYFQNNPNLPSCEVDALIERVDVQSDRLDPESWTANDQNSPECPGE
jgi:hypothetical protein